MTDRSAWGSLERWHAEAFFRAYVASHATRVASFEQRWGHAEQAAPALNFSRESLGAVWEFVLDRYAPLRADPVDDEREEILNFLPSGLDWEPPGGQPVGWVAAAAVAGLPLESVVVIDEVAAYFAECLLLQGLGLEWHMFEHAGDPRSLRPVLSGTRGNGSGFLLFPVREVEMAFRNGVSQSGRGSEHDWLQQRFDFWCDPPAFSAVDDPEIEVARRQRDEVIEDDDPTHVASFSDAVAHGRSEDVDELVRQLAGERRVAEVWREDREVVFVRTSMSDRSLRKLVERVWDGLGQN